MIAMALACEPELLIADEPTTALDVTVQRKILLLLKSLQHRLGMSLLLISHDLNLVRSIAQRVCVMHAGEIVEQADCETLFTAPQHPYSRLLLDAEPSGDVLCSEPRETVLDVHDLSVQFPLGGGLFRRKTYLRAVDGISLSVQRGKTLGIVGESGSGEVHPSGQADPAPAGFHRQHPLPGQGPRPAQPQADAPVAQADASGLPRPLRQPQPAHVGAADHQRRPGGACAVQPGRPRCASDPGAQGRGPRPASRHRFPHEFSGGQRQRIAIARALVLKPALMLLDEPTSALDRTVQKQVVALLRELQEKYGLTYLFISHDLAVVRAMAHDMIVIKDGKVVERGPSHDVFEAPQHPYTKELLAAAGGLSS